MGMILKGIGLFVVIILIAVPSAFAWNDTFHQGISRALAKNNITGCGEYRWIENMDHKNEFKVQCSRDGKKWVTWTVWVGIDKVQFVK